MRKVLLRDNLKEYRKWVYDGDTCNERNVEVSLKIVITTKRKHNAKRIKKIIRNGVLNVFRNNKHFVRTASFKVLD